MAKTIRNNQLTPGNTYLVRGKIGFSRISRHTTDEEREKANKTRMHPIDKNYTTLQLWNASVICKNPNAPTVEEMYAKESLYRSSSANYPGDNFTGINKSRNLPRVAILNPTTNAYDEIELDGELAQGLDATVVMRVFKGAGNNGVSLDTILINEPIRYYGDSNIKEALQEYGIVFHAAPPQPKTTDTADANTNATAPTTTTTTPTVVGQSVAQANVSAQPIVTSGYEQPVNGYNTAGQIPQTQQPVAAQPVINQAGVPQQGMNQAATNQPGATDNPFSTYNSAPAGVPNSAINGAAPTQGSDIVFGTPRQY